MYEDERKGQSAQANTAVAQFSLQRNVSICSRSVYSVHFDRLISSNGIFVLGSIVMELEAKTQTLCTPSTDSAHSQALSKADIPPKSFSHAKSEMFPANNITQVFMYLVSAKKDLRKRKH